MGDVPAAAAPGPPFGSTSTDMFLSASALDGTLSDPQTFQGHAASTQAPGMYSMPVSGGDLNGGSGFSYTETASQRTIGEIMGVGLDASSDAFADFPAAELEISTAQLGGVADGL